MRITPDGRMDYRQWNDEPEVWSYAGPFADHQEELTQQALSVAFMTAEEIQTNVQPPLPQIQVFRPRNGYPEMQDRQARIEDIVGVTRRMLHPASTWYSGGPAGYTGAPRYASNTLGLA